MSSCLTPHPYESAIDNTKRIVVGFITGLNVSKKSTPTFWRNPWATNLALCRSIEPFAHLFTMKILLQPTTLVLGGQLTSDQVSFFMRAPYFAFIPFCQYVCWFSWRIFQGSIFTGEEVVAVNALGLRELVRAWVTMECWFCSNGRKWDGIGLICFAHDLRGWRGENRCVMIRLRASWWQTNWILSRSNRRDWWLWRWSNGQSMCWFVYGTKMINTFKNSRWYGS